MQEFEQKNALKNRILSILFLWKKENAKMQLNLILKISFLSAEHAETTSAKRRRKSGEGFVRTVLEGYIG